jgi:GT2 family glycosyltransferase
LRASIVIAAFNEGENLLRTVRSCAEGAGELDFDIVVVDDGSTDGAPQRAARGFPSVRLLRHTERMGVAPSRDDGARHAAGEALIFLDGHCKPENGSLQSLVRGLEETGGCAVLTPSIAVLDAERWEILGVPAGDGYGFDLLTMEAGWVSLHNMRESPLGRGNLYESPALIGCAFAVTRALYERLRGFDREMRFWGVEDLDFSLKAWLMGHPILHDPDIVIGHSFQNGFRNYSVEAEEILANQLRMAFKHYAPGAWEEWVQAARLRHSGDSWERAWKLFEEGKESAEEERSYLLARCERDERWYARRFGLDWPGMPLPRPAPSGRSVLICAPGLPEFDRESGSQRVFDHIDAFQQMGWTVTYAARGADPASPYARLLEERGVKTECDFTNIGRLLVANRFDLALCAFWRTGDRLLPLIRAKSPHTRVVVDSVDLHFLRNGRRIDPGWDYRTGEVGPEHGREMRAELAVYEAADAVLTVSQNEAEILREIAGERLFPLVVPDGEDLPFSSVPWPSRRGIVFIGNFRHPPNAEAVAWLLQEIVPLLPESVRREHPVSIVGNGAGEDVRALAATVENVRVVGWVPSIVPYLSNARVMVAPLLHGAGTKRKLIQALMIGAPSVVTSIAAEGLPIRHEGHVLIADDAVSFAASIVRLVEDDPLAARLAEAGRAAVQTAHSRAAARAALRDAAERAMRLEPKLSSGTIVDARRPSLPLSIRKPR